MAAAQHAGIILLLSLCCSQVFGSNAPTTDECNIPMSGFQCIKEDMVEAFVDVVRNTAILSNETQHQYNALRAEMRSITTQLNRTLNHIDRDECASQPCKRGRCFDKINDYECLCESGYTGRNCENDINECASRPCFNGQCTDKVNGYECACSPGFSGHNCAIDVDYCINNPCVNGTCVNRKPGFDCQCFPGFSGKLCTPVCPRNYTFFRNSCFRLVKETLSSWSDARTICSLWDGDLAMSDSDDVNTLLLAMLYESGVQEARLGGTDQEQEGTWKWVDGTIFYNSGTLINRYSNFATGQPSNSYHYENFENCLSIWTGNSASWNDITCVRKMPFFCQIRL